MRTARSLRRSGAACLLALVVATGCGSRVERAALERVSGSLTLAGSDAAPELASTASDATASSGATGSAPGSGSVATAAGTPSNPGAAAGAQGSV
ncbi:MAG: hypothetical protein ACRDZ7_20015, partial [Acidimicrobiia bacterium]